MTKPDTYQCPADGCEYTGVRDSVAAHFSGTKNDKHSGGYEKAKTLLDSAGPVNGDDSTDGGGEVAPAEFPDTDSGSDSAGSVSVSTGGAESGDLDRGLSCPGCGETEELYEAEAVLRDAPEDSLSPNHRGLLKRSDAVCGSCGGVFDL